MILRNYRLGFDIGELLIFLIVMAPNIIWFAVPASNDVLRAESVTPVVDTIASVLQVLTVASLCFVVNRGSNKQCPKSVYVALVVCIALYYLGWALYYFGLVSPMVILMLTVSPCAAFIVFAVGRKNLPAIVFASAFAVCHLIFAFVNFM